MQTKPLALIALAALLTACLQPSDSSSPAARNLAPITDELPDDSQPPADEPAEEPAPSAHSLAGSYQATDGSTLDILADGSITASTTQVLRTTVMTGGESFSTRVCTVTGALGQPTGTSYPFTGHTNYYRPANNHPVYYGAYGCLGSGLPTAVQITEQSAGCLAVHNLGVSDLNNPDSNGLVYCK